MADARYKEFVAVIKELWDLNCEIPFGFAPADGKALKSLLHKYPGMTVEQFRLCLAHMSHSEGVALCDSPHRYLGTVTKYWTGPLDRYGKLKKVRL